MDSAIINQLAKGAIPQGLFALIAFSILWRRSARPGGDGPRLALTPVLFTLVYITTHLLVLGRNWPPLVAFDWVPVIAGIALTASLLLSADRIPAIVRWGATTIGLAAAGWMSSVNLIANRWTAGETAIHLGAFTLLTLAALWAAVRLTRGAKGPASVLLIMLPMLAASQLLVLAYTSVRLGQAAGVGVAMLGGVLAVSLWRRGLMLGVAGAAWAMLMAMACLYQGAAGEDPGVMMLYPVLVAASPAMALAARKVTGTKFSPRARTAIELAAAVLPLAAAMAVAIANRPAPEAY